MPRLYFSRRFHEREACLSRGRSRVARRRALPVRRARFVGGCGRSRARRTSGALRGDRTFFTFTRRRSDVPRARLAVKMTTKINQQEEEVHGRRGGSCTERS